MNTKPNSLKKFFQEYPETWFFVFATMTFVSMYVWTMIVNTSLHSPVWFLVFTILTIIHISIHWSLFKLEQSPQFYWVYFVVQGALAFIITQISQNIGMALCLYMALVGEMLGTFKRKIWVIASFSYLLMLGSINYFIMKGGEKIGWEILGILPILIFVVLYVSQYNRVVASREEAKALLAELEVANVQLSEYAAQVEDLTLTNERQRMARELHDTLAQGLAGLILQLEAADSHISENHLEKTQTIIQQAMNRARTTLAEARNAIGDLRGTPTSPTDLVEAIRSETEKYTHITGIPCNLKLCNLDAVPTEVAENVLRAVSEGLMNVAKHAQATETNVKMNCLVDTLSVEIRDNGVGFNPEEVVGRSGHFGLLGIRERARILGGAMTIESVPDQATTLRLDLPLNIDKKPVSDSR